MNKMIFAGLTMLALCGGNVMAQERGGFAVSLAGVGLLPVGDYADVAGFGFGALGGIEVGMNPGLALTARSGYIQHLEQDNDEDSFKLRHIPILGGLKFTVPETPLYLVGEVGAVMTRTETDVPFVGSTSDEETNLGWGAGFGTMAGPLDLRASFNVWDAANMSETLTIGLSLGFTIWTL
jgi:hypothetical protein